MDTQTQIDRLIELAIVQRAELKKLVSELPQLREHLNAEIERVFESTEPQLRTELEDWTTKQAHDQTVKLGGELEAKIVALSKSLEATTQTRYNAIMAERAQNIDLAKKAEDKLAEVAQAIPVQVKQIVTDELARFPRAGEIDQLRKEFAEPRGLNPRGRWEPGATYYKLDLVAYNGDSYVANEETSEKPNRTSSKWTLNAARGQAGGGGFMSPAIGDYTASMITNVPAGVITSTNVQDAINELAADVDVSQNTLDALVTNADSVTITKGQVVYAFGSVGNRMSVKLALNTGDTTSSKTIGVVLDSSIAAGATGNIRCVGVVDGLTLGSYTEGDVLYLGATAGSITATKPYAPNHLVYVGIVERANNGNGELYVKIQNGYELDEIHDVQITSAPLAGALLMRDATNSLWKANRLTGTTNQVTVTNADTAVTLSLPTSLASVDSITASASTALTLTGGSTGASLVLGQGATAGSATLTATGTGIVSVAGAASSGPATYAAQSRAGFTSYQETSGSFGYNRYLDIVSAQGADGTNGGGVIRLLVNSISSGSVPSEVARVTKTGNLLIGTTTDAASLAGGLVVNGSGAGAAASSTTTGALRVTGGVGVSGAGYFGGAVTSAQFASPTGGSSGGVISLTGANANIEMGTAGTTNTPFIDFHSSASSTDYDARIIASGGTASNGAGTLSLTAATINLPGTTSASSSTVGALTIGNGTAATNVAIGGGNVNAGGTSTAAQFFTGTQGITSGVSSAFAVGATSATTADVLSFGATARSGLLRGYHDGGGTITWQFGRYAGSFENWAELTGYSVATSGLKLYGTSASTGSTSGALQVTGGIYAGANSLMKTLGLVADVTAYNYDATLSNYSSTNGVYLNGNTAGWLRLSGSGGGVAQIQLNGGVAGAITMNTATANALVLHGSTGAATFAGTISPQQATTAGAPAYVKGAIYFDTTLNKLRVGGATAWETITSA